MSQEITEHGITTQMLVLSEEISQIRKVLTDLQMSEEDYLRNCNKRQHFLGISANPDLMFQNIHENSNFEEELRSALSLVEENIQINIRNSQMLMHSFEWNLRNSLRNLSSLLDVIKSTKLAVWKHEQQKNANGLALPHSIQISSIERWLKQLSTLALEYMGLTTSASQVLSSDYMKACIPTGLHFVEERKTEVTSLLREIVQNSLIILKQPPQFLKCGPYFQNAVKVSLLLGRAENICVPPQLKTSVIKEKQARELPGQDNNVGNITTSGEIVDGDTEMKYCEKTGRYTVTLDKLKLISIKDSKRRSGGDERAMEQKHCLYFTCQVRLASFNLKIYTISLPVVMSTHSNQNALALATIMYDHAFGEIGREPFKVPNEAPWSEVSKILNVKFTETVSSIQGEKGRFLSKVNLNCLAEKVFRIGTGHEHQPLPEKVSFNRLFKENLPGNKFTFFDWFYSAMRIMENHPHLIKLWNDGLLMGFIRKENASELLSRCETGTFLIRFSDSMLGTLTIEFSLRPGSVLGTHVNDLRKKNLALIIKSLPELKYLYQSNEDNQEEPNYCWKPKDEAFKDFFLEEEEETKNKSKSAQGQCAPKKEKSSNNNNPAKVKGPYVPLIPSLPNMFGNLIIRERERRETSSPIVMDERRRNIGSPALMPQLQAQTQPNLNALPPFNNSFLRFSSDSSQINVEAGNDDFDYDATFYENEILSSSASVQALTSPDYVPNINFSAGAATGNIIIPPSFSFLPFSQSSNSATTNNDKQYFKL